MTVPLPKWIQIRYAILWNRFKDSEFTFEDAEKVLRNYKKGINVFFSDLRKAGWLEVSLDDEDSRKRIYRLKKPEEAIKELQK